MTLRLLGGLQTTEIARGFLVSEATMAQRIVRAKRKIRDNHIAYHLPEVDEIPSRLGPVLAAIYLVFNEGHTATAGASLTRPELTGEALRLGRLLVELLPGAAEPWGLLALMVLTEARRPARVADGVLVRLADQDRNLWDRALVSEGQAPVRSCLEQNEPGAYQVQAAIAAVHADAPNGPATDWSQIVVLYDHLLLLRPTDVVSLNRAIAVAELRGPAAGLAALSHIDLDGYHLIHAAPGEFLRRLGRVDEVRVALSRAIDMATNEVELRHLRAQLDSLPD